MIAAHSDNENKQVSTIQGYYKWHAKIYQATRWTFLFGRRRIVKALELALTSEKTLLEVGCGTGHNLGLLARRYPLIHLIGLDISTDMLAVASKKTAHFKNRVTLIEQPYAPGDWQLPAQPDVILFSYCLTMINPGWEAALERAASDLKPGGIIAVVDFHTSPFTAFRNWMGKNHVRMEKHLLPVLEKLFQTKKVEVRQAYGGVWSYVLFVGKK
jgi:S-adenosylmethionine-diacylgycerolhomoserine-N-methlytransferase